jgi:hypothetical protein
MMKAIYNAGGYEIELISPNSEVRCSCYNMAALIISYKPQSFRKTICEKCLFNALKGLPFGSPYYHRPQKFKMLKPKKSAHRVSN